MTKTPTLETEKNFLIGVGSQRAGSTLLYRILNKSVNGIFMHPVKELHFFDSIHKIRPPEALKIFSTQQLRRINKESGDLIHPARDFYAKFAQIKFLVQQISNKSIMLIYFDHSSQDSTGWVKLLPNTCYSAKINLTE